MTQYTVKTETGLKFDLWLYGTEQVQYRGLVVGSLLIDSLDYIQELVLGKPRVYVRVWISKAILRYKQELTDVYESHPLFYDTVQDMLDPHYIADYSFITRKGE
jgi:hypothetical protein